ncbi:MAG: NADH-quinone oxidoreductase subunit NuoK [Deltaproteobacteria bacterium]|nr:NADH-quinone oxidoreductase subunit NuoK [Deltaproteobacteria bacterium]
MIHVGLQHFLVVAALLFCLGLTCVLVRRNAVAILIGIELILNAAGLNLIAFARFGGDLLSGTVFVVFLIVLAAAEAVVGLALIIAVHRRLRDIDLERSDELRG